MRRSIVWNAPAVQCSLGIEARWSLFLIVPPLDINVLPAVILERGFDCKGIVEILPPRTEIGARGHSIVKFNKSITSETLFELCETYRHRFFEYGVYFQVFCSALAATSVGAL